jgi:FemAB family protein
LIENTSFSEATDQVMYARLEECFAKNDLEIRKYTEASTQWRQVLALGSLDKCVFDIESIDYYIEYCKEKSNFESLSSVVFQNSQPIAVFVLEIANEGKTKFVTSNGGNITSPIYLKDLSKKVIKKINESLLTAISEFRKESFEYCFEYELNENGCSDWYVNLVTKYKVKEIVHNLYVDLSFPIEEIKSNFRKSFRPLVNRGVELWDVKIIDYDSTDIDKQFITFRDFHAFVAGYKSRSNKSWALQAEMVKVGKAFVVSIFDDDELIGFGFFPKNDMHCVYAVGVYDRDRFSQPLGHVVQFKAIEYMKKMGVKKYQLGIRFFLTQQRSASEKEINISHFKEGFANLMLPAIVFKS